MTRPEKMSKRKAFNKAIRARAAEEQTSFASVLKRAQDAQQKRSYRAMINQPTHPVRLQRQNMMGAPNPDQLHESFNYDSDTSPCYNVLDEVELNSERETIVVDLMAMAKPAKVKGVAKDFEVVKRVKQVIALEDSVSDIELAEDDWEKLEYNEGINEGIREGRTYSAALRGR